MKINRSLLREKIMKILYQIDLYNSNNIIYSLDEVIKENYEIENDFINDVVNGVLDNKDLIDETISNNMKNWKIDRLGFTDKAILRMATYEIMFFDTPKAVAINEAVNLSKKYSDDKVFGIINGVLDNIEAKSEWKLYYY